jgi:hypothetical protein
MSFTHKKAIDIAIINAVDRRISVIFINFAPILGAKVRNNAETKQN